MSEPAWLRGAAIVAVRAGIEPEEAAKGFSPVEAGALAVAMSCVAAPRADAHGTEDGPLGHEALLSLGARVLASMVRSLDATARGAVARAFPAEALRAAGAYSSETVACDGSALYAVISRWSRASGRPAGLEALGALALAATGSDAAGLRPAQAVLRAARVHGTDVASLFAPFARPAPAARVREDGTDP